MRPSEAARAPHSIGADFKKSFQDLKETAAALADPKGLLGFGSEFRPDPDPEQRRQIVDGERAARDASRRPYLANDRTAPVPSRIATRGNAQFEDLANYLAAPGLAHRPDLVFGVYRVPDRLDPKMPGSEAGQVVEWDIVHTGVHAPNPGARSCSAARAGSLRRRGTLASRRKGDPAVQDNLALAWMAAAGLRQGSRASA